MGIVIDEDYIKKVIDEYFNTDNYNGSDTGLNKRKAGRMSRLKPCPFCGGEAELIKQTDGYKLNPVHIIHSFYVECSLCEMSTKTFQSDIWQDDTGNVRIEHNGAEEAIEAWNRRAERRTDDKTNKGSSC